ncbi:MAG: hypothetical protein V4587_08425 [Acidobacteriota bacterium]
MMWTSFIFGVGMATAAASGLAQTACSARTPERAAGIGWVATSKQSASASSSYYRLAQIIVDPELHRRWALIADCTHPERPLLTIALAADQHVPKPSEHAIDPKRIPDVVQLKIQPPAERPPRITVSEGLQAVTAAETTKTSSLNLSAVVPVIRAGDLVRLWSSDGNVRLEMAVVSLEYGRIGQIIHLRRPGQTRLLAGVVVGKASAELIP